MARAIFGKIFFYILGLGGQRPWQFGSLVIHFNWQGWPSRCVEKSHLAPLGPEKTNVGVGLAFLNSSTFIRAFLRVKMPNFGP